MSRSRVDNGKLPECKFFHELSILTSVGEPQESHNSFISINQTSVTETFEEAAPISVSDHRDLNFKVTPKSKREQDDQSTYKAFLGRHVKLFKEEPVIK